jgi:hypothetical protein
MSKISGELFLCCASSSRIIFSPFELSLYTYLQICGVPWFEPRLFFFWVQRSPCCIGKQVGDLIIAGLSLYMPLSLLFVSLSLHLLLFPNFLSAVFRCSKCEKAEFISLVWRYLW